MNKTNGTPDALALCLQLAHAHARLARKLDDELGSFHGLGFGDFLLLQQLAGTAGGCLPLADLAQALGRSPSAVARQLAPLEKTGLIERAPRAAGQRGSDVLLRAPGRQLVRHALDTMGLVCERAERSLADCDVPGAREVLGALAGSRALDLAGRVSQPAGIRSNARSAGSMASHASPRTL